MSSSHIPFIGIPHPNTSLADLRPQSLVEEYWGTLGLTYSHTICLKFPVLHALDPHGRDTVLEVFTLGQELLVISMSAWIGKKNTSIYIYLIIYIP